MKQKIQTTLVLVFPDFDKPFLLETNAFKEGLGVVLSQKQDDRWYCPITFRSQSLTLVEKNYYSSKLEFLTLNWSVMEHFKQYLVYAPFVVKTDNNPLTYVLTIANLYATGHRWVSALASFEFSLEYQKEMNNGAADALSRVPIKHDCMMVQSLLEGAVIGTVDWGEVEANESLICEHVCPVDEVRMQAAKLASMHVVDWQEAQEGYVALATCVKWLKA